MNKTAIKNFAIWARNKLIADICYRAGLMGITEKGIADPLPQSTLDVQFYDIGAAEPYLVAGEAIKQRRQLVSAIREKEADTDYATAYQYIMEEVAYTWFNRLIAVRFMEVNDYLPSHLRVLSSESGKVEPDLVTIPFDAELPFTAEEEAQIIQWKQDNKLDELFRFLFIKQCNALNEILPGLFEKTTDYTEVLLNLSVVDQEGVVYKLTHDIPEKDFNIEQGGQVEIIGWLYQYYNTEPKAAAFAKNGKITKEEIPAVTQLFTPDWIVRYMVENSLGRLWVEGHPDSDLRKNWKYYLDEAPQEPEVQAKLATIRKEYAALNPEDLTLIDPCMGSGHILVYAFDVLMQIYESVGYSQRDAAKSILEHNLYGLDIDDRAYQLAYFAVMMKARQYNRRILNGENTCHVYAIQESNPINRAHLKFFGAGLSDLEKNTAKMQLEGLLDILTDAKEYGSILNVPEYNWELLRQFVGGIDDEVQISLESAGVEQTAEELQKLIDLGETMARKYWVTVTNPPYMGGRSIGNTLGARIQKLYPDGKQDLFAVFIEKCESMMLENGMTAMITMHSFMFLSSFENLRHSFLQNNLVSLVHLGIKAFDEIGNDVVQTASYVFRKSQNPEYKTLFVKLVDCKDQKLKETEFLNRNHLLTARVVDFLRIPGYTFAYWVPSKFIDNYEKYIPLGNVISMASLNKTGDNEKYLRCWWEIGNQNIGSKWIFYSKGGDFRRYYGNLDVVIDWSDSARWFYKTNKTSNLLSEEYWYREGITYSAVTSRGTGFRYLPVNCVYDMGGPAIFINDERRLLYTLALLNSSVATYYFNVMNPSINLQTKDIKQLPYIEEKDGSIDSMALTNKILAEEDWNSSETSVKFVGMECVNDLEESYQKYSNHQNECSNIFADNLKNINREFAHLYDLPLDILPEYESRDNAITINDATKWCKAILSYAVGCMFGRYSTYKEGLLFAGEPYSLQVFVDKLNDHPGTVSAEELERAYRNEGVVVDEMFFPDEDNVIPITDEEYLDDDIVARLCDWLKAVYGAAALEENLNFIAKALGNKGSTSREVIRNYFVNDFFKDHCQTYSVTGSGKRPIYWLFDSGKQNGFKALVYLHRYTPDTIGTLRVDYLHKMQRVYESEINRMQDMMDHTTNAREAAAASKRKDKLTKQLKECRDYDEKISHLALSRIALDLDDGVKVNYRKLQTAADGKFYEVLADSKNIMAKEKK